MTGSDTAACSKLMSELPLSNGISNVNSERMASYIPKKDHTETLVLNEWEPRV